jgi:hypothetical protein
MERVDPLLATVDRLRGVKDENPATADTKAVRSANRIMVVSRCLLGSVGESDVRQCVKMARQIFLRLSVEVLLGKEKREGCTHTKKLLNKPPRVIVIVNVVG